MWFRTLFDSMKQRRSGTPIRRTPRRAMASRLRVEALEDRSLLSFSPAVTYPVGAGADVSLVAGDLNGDRTVDLVAGDKVLLGNPDGTFQPAREFGAVGTWALADFNRDGRLDALNRGSNGLDIQLGNGDGTFQPVQTYGYQNGGYNAAAMGDINNDGNPDVVMGWYELRYVYEPTDGNGAYFTEIADVYLGDGFGGLAFSSSVELVNIFSYPDWPNRASLMLADFSGDGRLDIAAELASYSEWNAVALLGNGDGTFQAPYYTNYFPAGLVGDFNGDNRVDIARTGDVQLGNGDGTFQPPQPYDYPAGAGLSGAGEFDGDGRLDLVTTYHGTWDAASGQYVGSAYLSVLLGNGNGTFQAGRDFSPGDGPYSLAIADFNGDALSDLAVGLQSSGAIAVLLNDGNWPVNPWITISDATFTEGNTGTTAATFTVTLSAASSQAITVAYATADGSATAGSDYQAASGTLIFAPGETTKIIAISVNGDRLAEPNETFSINLTSPNNATIADGQAIGTIVDDEPRISISDVSKKEGKKGQTTLFTFTVTLSAAYDQPVTMSYRTVNGTATTGNDDYVAKTGTLTFAPGETMKTITIEVKGDSKKEANETFYLDLYGLGSNALFTKNRGIGTIVNDD